MERSFIFETEITRQKVFVLDCVYKFGTEVRRFFFEDRRVFFFFFFS